MNNQHLQVQTSGLLWLDIINKDIIQNHRNHELFKATSPHYPEALSVTKTYLDETPHARTVQDYGLMTKRIYINISQMKDFIRYFWSEYTCSAKKHQQAEYSQLFDVIGTNENNEVTMFELTGDSECDDDESMSDETEETITDVIVDHMDDDTDDQDHDMEESDDDDDDDDSMDEVMSDSTDNDIESPSVIDSNIWSVPMNKEFWETHFPSVFLMTYDEQRELESYKDYRHEQVYGYLTDNVDHQHTWVTSCPEAFELFKLLLNKDIATILHRRTVKPVLHTRLVHVMS